METITIKKELLLNKVRANRDSHRIIAAKAREGYRVRAIIDLQHQLSQAKAGKPFQVHLHLVEPEDHTSDYNRVIEMLELSADDLISLRERDFRRYVRDEWEWKEDFEASTCNYIN